MADRCNMQIFNKNLFGFHFAQHDTQQKHTQHNEIIIKKFYTYTARKKSIISRDFDKFLQIVKY